MTTPELEYQTVDKSTWGSGPWVNEPDKAQWPDAETKLPCIAKRNHKGSWCGYVGVDESHPWYGIDTFDPLPGGESPNAEIKANRKIEYAAFCVEGDEATSVCHVPGPGDPEHVWWFGFNCAGEADLNPVEAAEARARGAGDEQFRGKTYRTLGYVAHCCAELAAQLVAVESQGAAA